MSISINKEKCIGCRKCINVCPGSLLNIHHFFLYNPDFLNFDKPLFSIEDLEEAMQKIMDTYAGGISRNYAYNEKQLKIADEKINEVINLTNKLRAEDMHELMFVYELKERLTVCKSVIAHLRERKETRWHSFAENLDYREKSYEYLMYALLNSSAFKRLPGYTFMIYL